MYPWPSFGTFVFTREESALWGTDIGWGLSPSFAQTRPIGSTKDHIIATTIGSRARSFEVNLEPDRLAQLEAFLNTTALFTDWERPLPDSRQAFLSEVTPADKGFHIRASDGSVKPIKRVRITLISQ